MQGFSPEPISRYKQTTWFLAMLLDTPCTAGAWSRPRLTFYALSTASKNPVFITFYWIWRHERQNMVFQGFKKVQKRRSKLDPEPTDTSREQNNLCFFRIPKNRCVKLPLDSSTCPPPYLSPAKSNYFPNKLTNRTDRFLSLVWSVSTDVKGASRN